MLPPVIFSGHCASGIVPSPNDRLRKTSRIRACFDRQIPGLRISRCLRIIYHTNSQNANHFSGFHRFFHYTTRMHRRCTRTPPRSCRIFHCSTWTESTLLRTRSTGLFSVKVRVRLIKNQFYTVAIAHGSPHASVPFRDCGGDSSGEHDPTPFFRGDRPLFRF